MSIHGLPSTDLDTAIGRVERLLLPLRGERIFVTGGTGFVGTWLVAFLMRANRRRRMDLRVTLLTRDPVRFRTAAPDLFEDGFLDTVKGDVRDFEFPNGGYAAVIHGAGSSDNQWNTEQPGQAVATIVGGALRALEFARVCGAGRFLLLSSGAVYGRPAAKVLLREDLPTAPVIEGTAAAAYGEAKRVAEVSTLLAGQEGLHVVIARIFSVYGPLLPLASHFAMGNFILDAFMGRPVTVRGDGSPVRTYLYGSDLAAGLAACLTTGAPGTAYNIGGSLLISLGELARLVAEAAEPPVGVRILAEQGSSDWYAPDISRARDQLGFEPAVSLADGIRASIAWAKATHAA